MTDSIPTEIFQSSAQQAVVLNAQQWLRQTLIISAQLQLDAEPERARLEAALEQLCERHEVLRTRYKAVSGLKLPAQEIAAHARFAVLSADSLEQAREQLRAALSEVPLALVIVGQDLLLGASLASLDEQAMGEVAQELLALYQGRTLAEFDGLQYADYAAWQADLDEEDIGRQGKVFWRGLFAEYATAHPLPFERRVAFASHLSHSVMAWPQSADLLGFSARQQLSPAQALGFFWGTFLARLAQQDKLLVAVAADGRNAQLDGTVGHFAKRLPVAFAVHGQRSVADNLALFKEQLGQSRSWQDCLNELDMFGLQAQAPNPLRYGCSWQHAPAGQVSVTADAAVFETLHLRAIALDSAMSLQLSAQPEVFPDALRAAWLEQFIEFVSQALANVEQTLEQVPLVAAEQARRLLSAFDRGQDLIPQGNPLLHGVFERAAAQHPDHIAIDVGGRQVSYAELDQRANQLAHTLRAHGVGPDQVVGVYGARSVEIIIALLGILKAGGAYLPLDPSYPAERLSFMLEDARAHCLIALQPLHADLVLADDLTQLALDAATPCAAEAGAPNLAGRGDHLAYVIYTSGSTGKPKGVMVSHANASSSTQARFAFYREPVRGFLMLSSFSFDSSVAGIFWALGQRATLFLPREDQHKDPLKIAEVINRGGISHFLALPSFYAQILESLHAPGPACVIVAGEACPVELVRRHRQLLPGTLLVNEYGPSESAVWCTAFAIEQEPLDERVPIGVPIPGTRVRVLDAAGDLAGMGREGELYVGGPGLARGYLNRAGLTASRFLPDPFSSAPGQRLYRTGDRVCWRPDGLVDYLGRTDSQLKIRGFRIELGEIETLLAQQSTVREAAVVARDTAGGKQLIAYVLLHTDHDHDREQQEQTLLQHLREQLPDYMVPAFINVLERLPHTPNGKLDRNALAALELQGSAYVAPRNALETTLVQIWQEALNLERVGVQDNFFALGGHSLLATRIRSRVQAALNLTLPLRVFFEGETIELLARQVELHRVDAVTEDKVDALEALFAETEQP